MRFFAYFFGFLQNFGFLGSKFGTDFGSHFGGRGGGPAVASGKAFMACQGEAEHDLARPRPQGAGGLRTLARDRRPSGGIFAFG